MQPATVLIALSIYAMFPILKNTYAGLVSVDPQYIEAARGCGMTPYQRLYKIEIPLRCLPSSASANVHHLHGQLDCPGAMIGRVVWARSFTLESAPMTTDSS